MQGEVAVLEMEVRVGMEELEWVVGLEVVEALEEWEEWEVLVGESFPGTGSWCHLAGRGDGNG